VGSLALLTLLVSVASATDPVTRLDVKSVSFELPTTPVVLGETKSVELTVRAERPDGGSLDVAAPRFWASTGALSPPVRTSPGVWTTTFTPPTDRFPHVAILSATVDTEQGPAVGFVSLPLWGKGKLAVKTKPGSSVVVYIGNTSFGPAQATDAGVATVEIQAPPGPENAVAESTDAAGNVSSRTVPLAVPPFSRIALMAVDRVAPADGSGEATLLVFIVDKKGAPLFDASSLITKTTIGAFEGQPVGLAPGLFRLRHRPGVTTASKTRVEAALEKALGSVAVAEIRLIPGGPTTSEITVTRDGAPIDRVSADDDRALDVVVRFIDKGGNTTPHEAGSVTVDTGRLEEPRTLDDERLGLRFTLPDQFAPGVATITARNAEGAIIGSARVTLDVGGAHSLAFVPLPSVVADGRSAVLVRVRALDRAGNVVSSEGTTLTSSDGEIVGIEHTPDGTIAKFVPKPVREDGRARVRAKLGDLVAESDLSLVPPPLPFLTVKPALRFDWNYGRFLAAGPDLSMLVRIPGLLDETLHVGVEVALLPAIPLATNAPDGTTLIRGHTAVPFIVEGAWRPLLFDALRVHVGGGVGATVGDLSFVGVDSKIPQRNVVFAPGAQVTLGVGWRLGPGEIEALVRAGYFLPLAAPSTFFGSPTGVSLAVGYRFGL